MKAKIQIAIGLIGAGIFTAYWFIGVYTDILYKLRLPVHPALNFVIVIAPIYAFSVLLGFITIARIAYYVWVVIVFLGTLLSTFVGCFTLQTDNVTRDIILIILIMLVFSILLIAPFAIGISGLKKWTG